MIGENRFTERMIPMKTNSFTEEQIVQSRREAETGAPTSGSLCRAQGIAENTFYCQGRQVLELDRRQDLTPIVVLGEFGVAVHAVPHAVASPVNRHHFGMM